MDGTSAELDIDHLRGWIGREEVRADCVTEDLARKYHAMLDLPGEPPETGAAVPRLIHFCLAQPAVPASGLGPDGHPQRGGFLPPVPLPRRMWAGGGFTFHGDLVVGDAVRRVSRIEDITLKHGRTGALCFVTVSHRIETGGRIAVDERQDIVYRDLDPPGGAAKAPPKAEQGLHEKPMTADATLLFRYSALTFNGHRIHYDRRYVTEIEGYPGLVVHGPMQAALLCNYAGEIRGTPPTRFSFRGLSPLFDDDAFALHAAPDGEGLKLWTAKADGTLCMSAEVGWE